MTIEEAIRDLMAAGLPLGPPRRPPNRLGFVQMTRALICLVRQKKSRDPALQDALSAYLSAFRHHWPTAYRKLVRPIAPSKRRALNRAPIDPNRYLKLRRIAIENLSSVL